MMWIKTEDELPEEGVFVIAATNKKAVFTGWYSRDGWEYDFPLRPLGDVTHWQPLPQPPEE